MAKFKRLLRKSKKINRSINRLRVARGGLSL